MGRFARRGGSQGSPCSSLYLLDSTLPLQEFLAGRAVGRMDYAQGSKVEGMQSFDGRTGTLAGASPAQSAAEEPAVDSDPPAARRATDAARRGRELIPPAAVARMAIDGAQCWATAEAAASLKACVARSGASVGLTMRPPRT